MGKRTVSFYSDKLFHSADLSAICKYDGNCTKNIAAFDTRKEILWKLCEKKDKSNQRNQKWKKKEEIQEKIEEET